jgi:hypothetical protein
MLQTVIMAHDGLFHNPEEIICYDNLAADPDI